MLLSAEHIFKDYGSKKLLKDVSLYLPENAKMGLIGVNGTGKSTLLKILAGEESPDQGSVAKAARLRVSYLAQVPQMNPENTVLEAALSSLAPSERESAEYEAKTLLTKLGIPDYARKTGALSGGQKKRVALAAAFVKPADVLILDEPTNHLDAEMTQWLEDQLKKWTGGLIMVTHDRYFLENVVDRIVELDRAGLYTYEANYSKYLELRAERMQMAEATERKRQALLRKEYQWIMRGARARSTKSVDRIARYETLRDQDAPEKDTRVTMAAASSRLGKKTVELQGVSKSFHGQKIIEQFSYTILRDDRIGVVGRNGAGKSTLLNLIAGTLSPDEGAVDVGATVNIGYFMQESKLLDPEQRAYDYICEIAREVVTDEGRFTASQMLERFLFTSDLQFQKIGTLSGGERRRLYLLGILMSAPNILLLDEPTNDLDIDTLTILEDYLTSFPGAIVAVSHDRYFLDKLSHQIFEVPGDGQVNRFVGNFSDYWPNRTQAEKSEPVKKSAPPERRERGAQKLKFSYKEQREFDTIDSDIEQMETELRKKEEEITLNASDYLRLQTLMEEKTALQKALSEKTDRWVYLNELAERIAAQKEN